MDVWSTHGENETGQRAQSEPDKAKMLTGSQGGDQLLLFPFWELEMVPSHSRCHCGRIPALKWLSADACLTYFPLWKNVLSAK